MPEEARIAFQRLRKALLSTPVLTLPRPDWQFAVIVDAATGSDAATGGLGAILAQIDDQGKFHAVCYASRRLNDKESQYSPFLLEMAAAVWAIKTFKDHLNGLRFILFTDHKPLQKVALAQSKTLNEFQQLAYNLISLHSASKASICLLTSFQEPPALTQHCPSST
jgi:hypothetical protein